MKSTLDQTTVPSGAIIHLAPALELLASKREESGLAYFTDVGHYLIWVYLSFDIGDLYH